MKAVQTVIYKIVNPSKFHELCLGALRGAQHIARLLAFLWRAGARILAALQDAQAELVEFARPAFKRRRGRGRQPRKPNISIKLRSSATGRRVRYFEAVSRTVPCSIYKTKPAKAQASS